MTHKVGILEAGIVNDTSDSLTKDILTQGRLVHDQKAAFLSSRV